MEHIKLPYASGHESLTHCMAALDSLLIGLYAGAASKTSIYCPGMVMTSQETLGFLTNQLHAFDNTASQDNSSLQAIWHEIGKREQAILAQGGSVPILDVAERFDLSPFGKFCLLLAVSIHYDRKYESIFSYLQDDATGVYPTLGLAQALYCTLWKVSPESLVPPWIESDGGRLCFARPDFSISQMATPLQLPRRISGYLLGEPGMDALLDNVAHYLNPSNLDPLMIHEEKKEQLVQLLSTIAANGGNLLVHLLGTPGSGRKLLLRTVSAQLHLSFLSVDIHRLLRQEENLPRLLDAITTEACLTQSAVHLEFRRALNSDEQELYQMVEDVLTQRIQVLCITAAKQELPLLLSRAYSITLNLEDATISQREELWRYYSKDCVLSPEVTLSKYASQYYATPDQIRRSVYQASALAAALGKPAIEEAQLSQAILQNRTTTMDGLAVQLHSKFTWDDIELKPEQKEVLQLASARMRLRKQVEEVWGFAQKVTYGRGVSVLMYGPPGTGKTMAAQVLANDIGLELYRVDLSQIISKYIGETEKNLAQIFDVAQKSNVILFFDEADSLFAKRTEVGSSNDRHANTETAYILQRIEAYDGMTILATNLNANIDAAFNRRITYSIGFEMPDSEMRLRLWMKNLPANAPVSSSLNLEFFAKNFEISGSAIKQILLNAAYMAAKEQTEITPRHIVLALKFDMQKSGKLLSRESFGSYACYL